MEKISISIPDNLAEKWAKTPLSQKKKIEDFLAASVSELLYRINEGKFDKLLENARNEAEEKGLTAELLESMLNED